MANTVSRIISNDQLNKEITIESNGKPTIKAKTSSATGFGQFLDQTWLGTLKQHGPADIAARIVKRGKRWIVPDGGEQAILNLRKATTPALKKLNIDMLARFTEDNARAIGSGFTDGDLYLAHFLGASAAKKMFRADPNASAVSVAGQNAANANEGIFYVVKDKVRGRAKTASELRAWAQHAMDSRWAKAGKPDWIAKYYPKGDVAEIAVPVPKPRSAVASDDDDDLPTKVLPEIETDDAPIAPDDAAVALPAEAANKVSTVAPAPTQSAVKGDPNIWNVQRRLKDMNYNPGGMDGRWGDMTSGAISAFLNARPSTLSAPTSLEMFMAKRPEIEAELSRAEAQGHTRRVSVERANADQAKVEEIEPAAKPVNQSYFAAKWTAITGAVATAWTTFKDQVAAGWSLFFEHKDDLPSTDTGLFSTVAEWFGKVPTPVWVALGTIGVALLALRLFKASRDITQSVQTGARQ